jgi:hypothetical protein
MSTTIELNDEMIQLKSIKAEFSTKFPHLKIEFFDKSHQEGQASPAYAIYDESLTLNQIRKEGKIGAISIHGNLKTSSLEKLFAEEYGIHVQVLRKSGNVWLQTTATDDWTLAEQEAEASGV